MRIFYRRVISLILIFVVCYFLGMVVYREWDNISGYNWSPDLFWLFSSITILLGSYIVLAYGWTLILKMIGGRIAAAKGIFIYLISIFGRYIPGGIWTVLGRVYLCRLEGIPDSRSSMSILLEQAYPIVTAGLIFAGSLLFWDDAGSVSRVLPLIILLPLFIMFLHPQPILTIINPILVRFGKGPVNISLSFGNMLILGIYYSFYWLIASTAFYFFIRAFYPIELYYIVIIIGIYAISFTVGYLAFFTPAGLGVREGTLTLLLSLFIPMPVAIGVSLISRLWLIGVELIILGVFIINTETRRMVKTALGWSR